MTVLDESMRSKKPVAAMARPRNFSREEVLQKAIPLFWEKGFADTTLQDLEAATGVNKSGLYSEFSSKEDIFLESLKYYLSQRDGSILKQQPLGWENIKAFLGQACPTNSQGGCLAVYSLRELSIVPEDAHKLISDSRLSLKHLLVRNFTEISPKCDAEAIADVVLTFFTGLCLEQNLGRKRTALNRKIEKFVEILGQIV